MITATGGSTLNTIMVPEALTASNAPVTDGAAVVYHDGGGSPIGGLTDGTTYYLVVVKPGYYELDSNQSDAQNAASDEAHGVVTPRPTQATGEGHSLETTGADAKVGIGASVAVNLVDDTTQTEAVGDGSAGDGASLTGARTSPLLERRRHAQQRGRRRRCGQGRDLPSVAVSIPNVTTTASFGAVPSISATGQDQRQCEPDRQPRRLGEGRLLRRDRRDRHLTRPQRAD